MAKKRHTTSSPSSDPVPAPVTSSRSRTPLQDRVYERIQQLRADNSSEYAFRLIERLLCRQSPEPEWFYLKGCCSMDLGWFALGAESFAAASFFCPEQVDYRLALANSLLLTGQEAKGLALIRDVLKKDAEHFQAHLLLGQHHEQREEWRSALSHYDRIKSQTDQPGYPQYLCHLALCQMHMGLERQALEHLEEAWRLDGDDPEILFAKGVANGQIGEYETALIDMEEVIKRQPADPEALAYSAMFLYMLGQKPQAVARLEKAYELAP
ncbi:MAG TPA: tetratricopeptide repeat protein, partial [Candidatus Ozemobacteraceae bacterium]|nr:tetratricopeptide repeat protein [Candidatus Ozemobacteraceae bacterium]